LAGGFAVAGVAAATAMTVPGAVATAASQSKPVLTIGETAGATALDPTVINDPHHVQKRHDPEWHQIMSLPRRLTLLDSYSIGVEPAGAVESLRHSHVHIRPIHLPANIELTQLSGNTMEIIAQIPPGSASVIELDVPRSPDGQERARILYFRGRAYMRTIRETENGRTPAGLLLKWARSSNLALDAACPSFDYFRGGEECFKPCGTGLGVRGPCCG
jgi:hypothetical protein